MVGPISPDIMPGNDKPDIVTVQPTHLTPIELSVPLESIIKIIHAFKCNKYAMLVTDLRHCGLEVTLHAWEIAGHGYISPEIRLPSKPFSITYHQKY